MSLKFKRKVSVFAADGRYKFATHAEEAARLVAGGATPKTAGEVRAIQLAEEYFIGMDGKPVHPKPPTGTAIGGTSYTRELHLEYEYKFIHPADKPLFRAVQTACLAPFRT